MWIDMDQARAEFTAKIEHLTVKLQALTPPDMKDEVRAAFSAYLEEHETARLSDALLVMISRMARTGNPWQE